MIDLLQYRGPDATNSERLGRVAFGHTLLATTPEAAIERLPLVHEESGVMITADARLDNRAELIKQLARDRLGASIGDAELIVLAYLRWPDGFLTRLLGDFAFAIWDPIKQRLTCARDQMGVRQCYYHHDHNGFIFATDALAVARSLGPEIVCREERIADFFDELEGVEQDSSLFVGVDRLPPGHCISVDERGLRLARYWSPAPQGELRLPHDEYVEAFLEVFAEAVDCRARSTGGVGVLLSGGLDSGAVAAIASDRLAKRNGGKLTAFSIAGDVASLGDETSCIRQSHAALDVISAITEISRIPQLEADYFEASTGFQDPQDFFRNIHRLLWGQAADADVRVVLDGSAADVVLGQGDPVNQSISAWHSFTALNQIRANLDFWGPYGSAGGIFLKQIMKVLAAKYATRAWDAYVRSWHLRRLKNHPVLAAEFCASVDLANRNLAKMQATFKPDLSVPEQRILAILDPSLADGREHYDRLAGYQGVESRDPFLDLRLINFCLSLPRSKLSGQGWPKWILRKAMEGRLPQSVLWRKGKEHLGWEVTRSLHRNSTTEMSRPDTSSLLFHRHAYSNPQHSARLLEVQRLSIKSYNLLFVALQRSAIVYN